MSTPKGCASSRSAGAAGPRASLGRGARSARTGRAAALLAALLTATLAASCAAARRREPAPLQVPALVSGVSQRCGAPLGATAPLGAVAALEGRAEEGWLVRVELVASEFSPAAVGGAAAAPLGAHARLIAAEIGGAPVEPRTLLAHGAARLTFEAPRALASLPEFGRLRPLDSFESALPAGTTLRIEWRGALEPRRWPALRLEIGRASAPGVSQAELALAFENEIDVDHDGDPATPAQRVLRQESVLLDFGPVLDAATPLRVVLPSPFEGGEARGLVLELAVERSEDGEAREAALARCRASELGAGEWTRTLAEHEARRGELEALLAALSAPAQARAALLQLATRLGAELTADLALCAAPSELALLVAHSREALENGVDLAGPPTELGWRLERASLEWLATRQEARAIPYEFEGVLLRRTGELGRSPAALRDAAATCGSLAGFARRLREENAIFLDDHAAAARVRAFDWLAARGWAPANYDPLAGVESRRAALDAADAQGRTP